MAARGMFFGEGPAACPFVALENDRDRRSDEPDHRHRCYAEPDPAPRALAHQRSYCLAAAFTSCPIFQDWAIRAAATPVPLRPGLASDVEAAQPEWAEPPPWTAPDEPVAEPDGPLTADGPGVADEPGASEVEEPAAPEDGLFSPPAASARVPAEEDAPVPYFLASRAGEAPVPPSAPQRATAPPPLPPPDYISPPSSAGPPGEGQSVAPRRAQQAALQREEALPAWERQPLHPAYPTLRSRFGSGGSRDMLGLITRLLAVGAIVALIVVGIILAPGLLGGSGPGASPPAGGGTATATPGPPTASPSPSLSPSPSPLTYTISAGDTLFSIARRHGLTVEQLLAANPQITNPNVVQIGQVLIIPPDDFGLFTPTPEP